MPDRIAVLEAGVMSGVFALVAAVAAALVIGAGWRARQGRLHRRSGDLVTLPPLLLGDLGATLGPRATLVQFSSAFCAPCRQTRQVLERVAGMVEGVTHIEVDAESHLAAVRELGILRTPTTLVLDARGREVLRAAGVPRVPDVVAALGTATAFASSPSARATSAGPTR